MPFIIRKTSQTVKTKGSWKLIPIEDLRRYRKLFVERHQKLITQPNSLDFRDDFLSLTIDFNFFNTLVQQAQIGHYLVVHFVCDPSEQNFKNLDVALCIKEKGGNGPGKDKIVGKIYTSEGKVITEDVFCKARGNYNDRLKLIAASSADFANDRKGRAHEITEEMKVKVDEMGQETDTVYIYFIIDNYLNGQETISVVFSDTEINFEIPAILVEKSIMAADLDKIFDAYDHGTACCPIG